MNSSSSLDIDKMREVVLSSYKASEARNRYDNPNSCYIYPNQKEDANKIVDLLASGEEKRNAYMQIRQIVGDNKVNDFAELYTALYERLDDYAAGNTANVILELAQGQFRDALVIDKEICFMATIIAIINIIK